MAFPVSYDMDKILRETEMAIKVQMGVGAHARERTHARTVQKKCPTKKVHMKKKNREV